MEIYNNYDIKNETTFRIGGTVDTVAFPETIEELISIIDSYDIILGNCSNVLFSSEHVNKKIILTKKLDKFSIEGNRISVQCGTKGPVAAKIALENSLTGFEFLIGFPGSFGGMICMNASAHNQSIADTFVCARVYDKEEKVIKTFEKDAMKFGYRNSIINSSRYIILDAVFELKKGNKEEIEELVNRNIEFRRNRQPSLKYGNAGSIFKNPQNDSAGRLLDLCNLKSQKEGGAMIFEKHANFIINFDNATSKDVLTLMNKMYSKVKEKYTIKLVPEIKYIGDIKTEEYGLWEMITENLEIQQR